MTTILATFEVLKDFLKLKVNNERAVIDNLVFRLHYRATFLILLAGSILVCARHFFGQHIDCIVGGNGGDGDFVKVVESFCFFMSTFTVKKHMNRTEVELGHIPHPGIGPSLPEDEVTYHAYYQWVPFVLFFQAVVFYIPHYLWRKVEGGRLSVLVTGLHLTAISLRDEKIEINETTTIPSIEDRNEQIRQIRTAFINRLHINRPWAYYLVFYELFNFINVFVQFYLTNLFLGGVFTTLGFTATEYEYGHKMTPLDTIFPKVTKCTFHKYGPSGTIQNFDAMCIMSLNIVNEKIYIFLWFWYILLAIVTGFALVWRILTFILHARSKGFNRFVFSLACPGKYNPWNVLKVTKERYFSDWLFLYYIAKNVDNYVFKELLEQLAEDMAMNNRRFFQFDDTTTLEKMPLKKAR